MAKARLGMAFEDLRGTMGGQVVVRTRAGLAVRRRQRYKYPVAPAFRQASERMQAAGAVWRDFSAAEAEAWRQYAAGVWRRDPVTGERYSGVGRSTFMGLATKVLQVNPSAEIPRMPPVGDFAGDVVTVSAAAVAGGIRFTADRANAAGVTTELMAQKLANVRRMPGKVYKAVAFEAFESGSLSVDVPMEPGVYACAFRFVEIATGRQTLPMPIAGLVEV